MKTAYDKNSGEERRLAAVRDLNLLGTSPEERFDRITQIVLRVFSAPVAGIALVDKNRVWYKSIQGLQETSIPRASSFEDKNLSANEVYIVKDAFSNSQFEENPHVSREAKIRFYAGVTLKAPNGEKVGTLFVADRMPRSPSEVEITTLRSLAYWAELEIKDYQSGVSYVLTQEELSKKNRELAESIAKNEAMLENIGDGIIGINDGGEITYVNKQTENMLGVSEDDLVGKMLIHVVSLVDEKGNQVATENRPIRTALLAKKKVVSRDWFYVRNDGSKFAVAITATPVVLHGKVIGGVNVFRDVSREYEIDKMKTEFISLASHQLRTPLALMKWFSEMLLDNDAGPLNDDQRELINNIYQSNERMIQLVNSLLNISRIESGRIIIDPKPTDLKKLVEEVISELKPKIEEKKHHLAVSVHGHLPEINIDPKLVRHVYMNLISNAIKYTPHGGEITVIISKSGNEVISQVSDNGYGIPKHQYDKVFTKFFRGENVIKIVTEGTGLGLYLTKAIVESSGGKIWFESEEGKGTTFWFILPVSGSQYKEGEVSLDS
jgi:PAS domain S-box-containing protein